MIWAAARDVCHILCEPQCWCQSFSSETKPFFTFIVDCLTRTCSADDPPLLSFCQLLFLLPLLGWWGGSCNLTTGRQRLRREETCSSYFVQPRWLWLFVQQLFKHQMMSTLLLLWNWCGKVKRNWETRGRKKQWISKVIYQYTTYINL